MNDRKVILYIATSLDGYIAKTNDDLDFLSIVQKDGEDYGYSNFINTVDTVILGRKTYDWVMKHVKEFPHADKNSYIITRTARPGIGKTIFYTGDLKALILRLKNEQGKNIFITNLMNNLKIEEMKKFILIIAVISFFLTPAFSQINRPFKGDPALRRLSDFRNQEPLKLRDSIFFRSPGNDFSNRNYLRFPKYKERNFYNRQIPLESLVPGRSIDGMPCLTPRGYFPMPVVRPNPAIRYSLLIKRY